MNITGIIAEYNPFHNGHAYQLSRARKDSGADYIIVVMSGNFVQRGAPALLDKYIRAEMALLHGADLVLELPVLWASASAQYFASAGVSLLNQLGCVNYLCYGCETPDSELFSNLSTLLCRQPEKFRRILKDALKTGTPYALAREKAAAAMFPPSSLPAIQDILRNPNNILALEYQQAIAKEASPIKIFPIKRIGAGYHSNDIITPILQPDAGYHTNKMITPILQPDAGYHTNEMITPILHSEAGYHSSDMITPILHSEARYHLSEFTAPTASATAIRSLLKRLECDSYSTAGEDLSDMLQHAMPHDALRLLLDYHKSYPFIFENDCSQMLHYCLLKGRAAGFTDFADCSEDLSNKICRLLDEYTGFKEFCDLLKSKDLAYARICRCLLHILLDIKKSSYEFWRSRGYMPYARVLGFRRSSGPLLSHIKKQASLPLLMRASDAQKILTEEKDLNFFRQNTFADHIYRALSVGKNGQAMPDEYRRKMLVY